MRWTRGKFITSWPEPPRTDFGDDFLEVVYFVSGGGLTKIGRARGLQRRVAELAAACPMPLLLEGWLLGGSRLELDMHRRFAAHRVHGEWFRQSQPLRAFLNELQRSLFLLVTDHTSPCVTFPRPVTRSLSFRTSGRTRCTRGDHG